MTLTLINLNVWLLPFSLFCFFLEITSNHKIVTSSNEVTRYFFAASAMCAFLTMVKYTSLYNKLVHTFRNIDGKCEKKSFSILWSQVTLKDGALYKYNGKSFVTGFL